MIDNVLTLIAPAGRTQDAEGVWRPAAPVRREVFVRVQSISRAEFSAAGQNGMRPDLRFTIFFGEYLGETVCEYEGMCYAIYRTYLVPGTDDLELYVHREAGVHSGAQDCDGQI